MEWNPENLPLAKVEDHFHTISEQGATLAAGLNDPPETLADSIGILSETAELVDVLQDLKGVQGHVAGMDDEHLQMFGRDLVSTLVVQGLSSALPNAILAARLLTVLGEQPGEDIPVVRTPDGHLLRAPPGGPRLRFDHLDDLIKDPAGTLAREYFGADGLGGEEAEGKLKAPLRSLQLLLVSFGIQSSVGTGGLQDHDIEIDGAGKAAGRIGLRVNPPVEGVDFSLWNVIYANNEGDLSLLVVPSGSGVWTTPLGRWAFTVAVDADTDSFSIDADGVQAGPDQGQVEIGASLTKPAPPDQDVAARIGGASGTRLELGTLGADLSALLWAAGYEVDVRGRADDSRLVVTPGDGDGFLQAVLPDEGLDVDFDLGLGWSTEWGVYLEGSAGTDASIPIQKKAGPIQLQELYLALLADQDEPPLQMYAALSGALELGPITATVRRVGLQADVTFPEKNDGNLGPLDVDFGFKPPTGLGVEIKAGAVTGGGFIEHYPSEGRYVGALQLDIGEWAVEAVGLLETQLPSGREGYSFLLMITASEMPPIQLGAGFVLSGLGGLVGTHRGMEQAALQDAVRTGSMEDILFPTDVVENAPTIVSQLGDVFPVTEDQFVVGPMARITYGTPTLLTMDLAVVLQIPAWKIALLGRLQMALPDEKAPIVQINLDALGLLDIPGQRFSLDATMYDSRIVQYTLSGDMALRSRWGEASAFLLSVGGFHPRYEPPGAFPVLDPVKASLSPPSGNPELGLKGYVAVTPNTFQVGAEVAFQASIDATVDVDVSGHLGFDALFQFNPFKFLALFDAQLTVAAAGETLTITASGELSGPSPFYVQATLDVDLGLVAFEVDYSDTIGEDRGKEELPTADILSELVDELETGGNWQGQGPGDEPALVMLRRVGADGQDDTSAEGGGAGEPSSPVLVHPLGGISVSQSLAPLEDEIETFGNARPATYDEFRIEHVHVDGDPQLADEGEREPVRARFAPAQFKEMSDDEKLETPTFVERTGGTSLQTEEIYYGGEHQDPGHEADRTEALLEHETIVVDRKDDQPGIDLARLEPFRTLPLGAARFGVPAFKTGKLLREREMLDRERALDRRLEVPTTPGVPSPEEQYEALGILEDFQVPVGYGSAVDGSGEDIGGASVQPNGEGELTIGATEQAGEAVVDMPGQTTGAQQVAGGVI